MSTNNFASKSSTIFAIETGEDDEFICDDTQENVFYELNEDKTLNVDKENEDDGDRNYSGTVFARVELHKRHSDILYPVASVALRSGYYSDLNLDYEVKIYSAYSGDYLDLDENVAEIVAEELQGYNDRKPSSRQVLATKHSIDREVEKLNKKIEKVLAQYSTPIYKAGQFSNGEAVYKLVGAL
jgi:hypothetical protein